MSHEKVKALAGGSQIAKMRNLFRKLPGRHVKSMVLVAFFIDISISESTVHRNYNRTCKLFVNVETCKVIFELFS
jgi:hypothetical protein